MSLISDALKIAQIQRSERSVPKGEMHVLEGFFPFTGTAAKVAPSSQRVWLVAGVVTCVVAASAAIIVMQIRHRTPALRPVAHLQIPIAPTTIASATGATASGNSGLPGGPKPGVKTPAVAAAVAAVAAGGAAGGAMRAPSTLAEKPDPNAARKPSSDPATRPVSDIVDRQSKPVVAADPKPANPSSTTSSGSRGSGVTLGGPPPSQAALLVNQGIDAMNRGDYAAANGMFQAAQSVGTSRELFLNWARTLQHLGAFDLAAEKYVAALDIDATYVDAMVGYAGLLDMQHKPGAVGQLDHARKLEPDNVIVLMAYADQYDKLADYKTERDMLLHARAVDPTNAAIHERLGRAYMQLADSTDAAREYRETLQYAGNDPNIPVAQIRNLLKTLPGGALP